MFPFRNVKRIISVNNQEETGKIKDSCNW